MPSTTHQGPGRLISSSRAQRRCWMGVKSRPGFLSRAGVGCLLSGKKSSLAAGPERARGDWCVGALSQPLFGTFHPGSSQSPRLSFFHASQRLYVFHTAGPGNSLHARQELHSNNNNSWYLELLSRGRRPSLKKSTHVCSQQCGGGGLGLPARPGRDVRKLRMKHRAFPTGNSSQTWTGERDRIGQGRPESGPPVSPKPLCM